MPWPEDITSELPEPHPEEPARLRSDILDELYDHLQSSLEHEQLTEADQDAARKSVLSRFGNPATIACRLWWDAMWGKVMLHRVTLVLVILLCLCSVVATAFVWQSVQQSQQAIAALVANVEALSEREIVVTTALEDERLKYLDWIPVTVTLEYENGEPVTNEEFTVSLNGKNVYGNGSDPMNAVTMQEHPDSDGLVDFGLVKPGSIWIRATTPWKEVCEARSLVVKPGKPLQVQIVCPEKEPTNLPVNLAIDWPEDIRKHKLWIHLFLSQSNRQVANETWRTDQTHIRYNWLLVDPDGTVYVTPVELSEETRKGGTASFDLQSPVELSSSLLTDTDVVDNRVRGLNFIYDECRFVASLDDPADSLALPDCGVEVNSMWILERDTQSTNDTSAEFRPLLALDLVPQDFPGRDAEPQPRIGPVSWNYRPSDLIVELVRKRLEQIDAEQKPAEENTTEAAEVSAETN